MTERITKKQALRAASAKISTFSDKTIQANLDMALGECNRCSEARSYAEAYRIGIEEAQREIVARIAAIKTKEPGR